jgi:hypothetical protein
MSAPDKPNNLMLTGFVIGSVVLLVAMVLGVMQMFNAVVEAEISTRVLEVPSSQLGALRDREQLQLSRYQWVNKSTGAVRIPLDRAVELTLRDWKTRAAAPTPAVGSQQPVPPADGVPAPAQGTSPETHTPSSPRGP